MDPALLRERELFKKKAFANPVIEKKKEKVKTEDERPSSSQTRKKIKREPGGSSGSNLTKDPFSYKTLTGSSQYNFALLAKIVKYMKQKHLDGDNEPLTLEEILDETNQLDITVRQRAWLENEALLNNPKIGVIEDKYVYKATFQLKDRKSLVRLLDKYDQRGLGGIDIEDIRESLPNADKAIKMLGDNITMITRPMDKRKILFYKDKSMQFNVDEEFQKLWRSVAVDGLDDTKIDEYLQKQGITSMQDLSTKKVNVLQKRKKPAQRKKQVLMKHNEHMNDILKDYADK